MIKTWRCPYCGKKDGMVLNIIPSYPTRMGGKPIVVENAEIATCDICQETLVHARELKRWEGYLKKEY